MHHPSKQPPHFEPTSHSCFIDHDAGSSEDLPFCRLQGPGEQLVEKTI